MDCRYQVEVKNNDKDIRAGLDLLSRQTYLWEDGSVANHKFDRVCWTSSESSTKVFLFIHNGIYRPETSPVPLDKSFKMLFLEDIGKL